MVRGKFTDEKGERRSYLFENQMDINLGGSRTKLSSQSQDRASVGVINDRKVRGGNMIMCPPSKKDASKYKVTETVLQPPQKRGNGVGCN